LTSACTDDGADDSCTATHDEYAFSEETSMGISMASALSGRMGQTADLAWAEPRDWLEHSADADTEIVVRLARQEDLVEEVRNAETGCQRVLRSEMRVTVATADGQLDFEVGGTVTVYDRKLVEIEVDILPSDLDGILQVSSDVSLRLSQTIDDEDVEGTLTAYTQGESSLRNFSLATWQGSVGAESLPRDPAAPTPDDATGDAGSIAGTTDGGTPNTQGEAGAVDSGLADGADAAPPTNGTGAADASAATDAGDDRGDPPPDSGAVDAARVEMSDAEAPTDAAAESDAS
jgi:hypothetical protein